MRSVDEQDAALRVVRRTFRGVKPAGGIVLGSGWSEAASGLRWKGTLPYSRIPGLGAPGVLGHGGQLVRAEHAGIEVLVFLGRRHWYEGEGWGPVSLPIRLLKALGAEWVLLTNGAGGVNPRLRPGTIMSITDHVNAMGVNPLVGAHDASWGARFPDMTEVYDAGLRRRLAAAACRAKVRLARGVYLAVSGPSYETPAEIRVFWRLGADAVGMSTVPEAILARAGGLRVAGLTCITNLAAGLGGAPLDHGHVLEAAQRAAPRLRALVREFVAQMAAVGRDTGGER